MERLVLLIALTGLAVLVALLLQRRRPDPPSAPSYRAPSQLDRQDFDRPDTPLLVVVFASDTCSTCPAVWSTVRRLASDRVGVQQVTVQSDPGLHQRYRIDGVPTTVVADEQGSVTAAWFGPVSPDDLTETGLVIDP